MRLKFGIRRATTLLAWACSASGCDDVVDDADGQEMHGAMNSDAAVTTFDSGAPDVGSAPSSALTLMPSSSEEVAESSEPGPSTSTEVELLVDGGIQDSTVTTTPNATTVAFDAGYTDGWSKTDQDDSQGRLDAAAHPPVFATESETPGDAGLTNTETCHDGVSEGSDGGSQLECPTLNAYCGDAVVDSLEICDDGINDNSYNGCSPGCTALGPYCGDANTDAEEACDDGINDGSYATCGIGCAELGPFCGDGITNGAEVCDDGVNDGTIGGCEPGCVADGPDCGDGTVQSWEQCDDANDDDEDACSVECQLRFAQIAYTYAASGGMLCGILSDQSLRCWGDTGLESTTSEPAPTDADAQYSILRGGDYKFCAITTAGALACWGQLWDSAPVPQPTATNFVDVSLGVTHACAIDDDRLANCWGYDTGGQIDSSFRADAIAVGSGFTCWLKSSPGAVACQGITSDSWTLPSADVEYTKIASALGHVCAINVDTTIDCFGTNQGYAGSDWVEFSQGPTGADMAFRSDGTYGAMRNGLELPDAGPYLTATGPCGLRPDNTVVCVDGSFGGLFDLQQ